MDYMRDSVISCLNKFSEDERLIDELNIIIEKEGAQACQVIFHVLTHLDLEPDEARKSWQTIIEHRRWMSDVMSRSVDIRTAICDYFSTVNHQLKNPKVVEIHIFERTFKSCRYDPLTGIFNRLAFENEITRELSRAKRYENDLSLLFFDLDNFKKVNDTYGHQAGDMVLKSVANALLNGKRTEDLAVRYGGEELILILPNTHKYDALLVGDRIRQEIEEMEVSFEGTRIPVTVSGGLASFPTDAASAYHLVKKADEAMYRAKHDGKNRIQLFAENKRRYLRLNVDIPLKLKIIGIGDRPVSDIRGKNFSLNGILFEYQAPIELGTKIQLLIPLDDDKKPFPVVGTVVRVEAFSQDRYDVGVSISYEETDYAVRDRLSKWYDSLMRNRTMD